MTSELAILHCDNHLLALNKPAGVATVPDASGDESLLEHAREWLRVQFEKPGRVFLGVVHRLDRPVSGVVLFARTSKAASRVSASFRNGEAQKTYWAVVEGELPGTGGEIEQWLVKDDSINVVRACDAAHPGAKLARTRWRLLERTSGRALLELEPLTGRPHQLRVAVASMGLVLLGDRKYGLGRPLADRSIALHARALALPHPTRGEPLRLDAAPPARAPWIEFGTAGAAQGL